MAHKITGRNMFLLYMYIIYVLFALLLKHGGNGSIVIAADLLHFNPYWGCPVCTSAVAPLGSGGRDMLVWTLVRHMLPCHQSL